MISSNIKSEKVNIWVALLVVASGIALFIFSQLSFYDRDEIEFVHTSWLILKGKVIYKDFFQHHHPLGYYFIIPFLKLFGESSSILIPLRFFYFIILLCVCLYTYKISRFFLDKNYSLFSIIFLMTNYVFNFAGIKLRSDVFLLLFCTISFYYLIRYFNDQKRIFLIISSFFSSLAFLVFQKAIFYLFSIFIIYIFLFSRKKKAVFFSDGFIYFGVFLFFTILGYFSMIRVSFGDYFFLNWKINTDILYRYGPWSFWSRQILYNPITWFFLFVSFYYVFFKKESNILIKAIVIHFLILVASMFFFLSPAWQYHLTYQPFLVIFSSYGLFQLSRNIKYKKLLLSVFVFSVLIDVCVNFLFVFNNIRQGQLSLISYGIKNSHPEDCVYDPYLTFNLFRYDCDYFWFGMNPSKGMYYAYIKTRPYDYNIEEIINRKKPKLISPFVIYPGLFFDLLSKYRYVSFQEMGIEFIDMNSSRERLYPILIRKDE